MRKYNITYESRYKNYDINNNQSQGCHTEILDKIIDTMEYYRNKRANTLLTSIVLNFPQGINFPSDNSLLTQFLENLNTYASRLNLVNPLDLKLVWIREQNKSPNCHYHIFFLTNYSASKNPWKYLTEAERLWYKTLEFRYDVKSNLWIHPLGLSQQSGLVHVCKPSESSIQGNGTLLPRNDNEAWAKAVKWMSYNSKTRTKGQAPAGVREFGSSAIH